MKLRKTLWTVTAMILAAAGVVGHRYSNREQLFLDHAFVQLRGGVGSEPVEDIKLHSGETVSVILEHDCCTGAGFDAVAIRTSDGREFFATKNYCGIEGFYGGLGDDTTKDLPHFTAFLGAQGYQQTFKEDKP
jgi:hypothetical protein